eukprot:CAMPEP_0194145858 /NCGR_PEP_ID=MMETSP0152-20130528/18876_1 /TAXON_ID=1049557 /ORGANISM="Thalassiothrix antarctica, Strain L6-D1" /LENGTH=616 /DNA_ID=CAMNT_0038846217 /DNA_START=27 /DNA_END=1877 /DNA_ORIENTATION=+
MLGHATVRRLVPTVIKYRRQYSKKLPSSAKRSLTKEQLAGDIPKVEIPKASKSQSRKGFDTTVNPGTVDPSIGGGEFMLPVAIAVTCGGAAWYFNLIPGLEREGAPKPISKPLEKITPEPVKISKEDKPIISESKQIEKEDPKNTKNLALAEAVEKGVKEVKKEEPPKEIKKEEPKKEVTVTQENHGSQIKEPVPQIEPSKVEPSVVKEGEKSKSDEIPQASVLEATKELTALTQGKSSETLKKAHQVLRSSVDESLFSDLENLTAAQLRVRVVQLGTEMMERTKWEAMRLKEFLAMKEKEVGENYFEMMQKQRNEFENLLALKLREQEDALSRQANSILQEKENGIQALVNATRETLEAEHKANLASTEELYDAQFKLKYETEYANKLKDEKKKFLVEMEKKVSLMEALSKKLEEMESALNVNRSITSGSIKAHRLSAAALTLTEKMETSKGAKAEVATLKSVLEDNNVISSAVGSMPKSVDMGTPTLSELQNGFESIYVKCRQAALVPSGRVGLEGQLLGIVLSSLKFAPSADDPVPDDSKDHAEYVLVKARQHVSMGELESAVEQLKKLKGQAAFTVRDWKQNAENRIAVDRALHVIKMEVALMNESLSKARQ